MADEQAPAASEATPEQRLAALFSADAEKPSTEPEGPEEVSASGEQTEPEQADQAEEQADDGFEEIDLDGETYKVPPRLKEAVLRQSDYTRKTQELAEHRRALDAQAQAIRLVQAFQQATAEDHQQLNALDGQIAQYQKVDWSSLDGETLIRAKHAFDTLKEQAQEVRQRIAGKAQQAQQLGGQVLQQFKNARAEALQKVIPGWNGEQDYWATVSALNVGFSPEEISNNFDARMGVLAWKAAQFDRLQAGKPAAVAAAKKAPPVIKPGVSQGQRTVAQTQYRQDRERLKKTGRVDDAAKLFLRMK